MTPFNRHTGVVAPLMRNNIDTDAIIPSREMKKVSRDGLADGLFAGWRYLDAPNREPDAGFVLNQPAYAGASILAAGRNFGCGSSREHAVWALAEYGIRAVLASSFGAIFERNCFNNGLLPVTLPTPLIEELLGKMSRDPGGMPLTIDLEHRTLRLADDDPVPFEVPVLQQQMLLNGWDPIDLTLQHAAEISLFEARDRQARPWAYDLANHA